LSSVCYNSGLKGETMSVEFSVKNKRRPLFLGYFGVMSVGKAAELIPDLAVFGIDENAKNRRSGIADGRDPSAQR